MIKINLYKIGCPNRGNAIHYIFDDILAYLHHLDMFKYAELEEVELKNYRILNGKLYLNTHFKDLSGITYLLLYNYNMCVFYYVTKVETNKSGMAVFDIEIDYWATYMTRLEWAPNGDVSYTLNIERCSKDLQFLNNGLGIYEPIINVSTNPTYQWSANTTIVTHENSQGETVTSYHNYWKPEELNVFIITSGVTEQSLGGQEAVTEVNTFVCTVQDVINAIGDAETWGDSILAIVAYLLSGVYKFKDGSIWTQFKDLKVNVQKIYVIPKYYADVNTANYVSTLVSKCKYSHGRGDMELPVSEFEMKEYKTSHMGPSYQRYNRQSPYFDIWTTDINPQFYYVFGTRNHYIEIPRYVHHTTTNFSGEPDTFYTNECCVKVCFSGYDIKIYIQNGLTIKEVSEDFELPILGSTQKQSAMANIAYAINNASAIIKDALKVGVATQSVGLEGATMGKGLINLWKNDANIASVSSSGGGFTTYKAYLDAHTIGHFYGYEDPFMVQLFNSMQEEVANNFLNGASYRNAILVYYSVMYLKNKPNLYNYYPGGVYGFDICYIKGIFNYVPEGQTVTEDEPSEYIPQPAIDFYAQEYARGIKVIFLTYDPTPQ